MELSVDVYNVCVCMCVHYVFVNGIARNADCLVNFRDGRYMVA